MCTPALNVKSPIIEHEEIAGHARRLVLAAPEIAGFAEPGQFVHVLCGDSYDPLLRRPFSVHDVDRQSGRVRLLYEIRGRGTALLAEKRSGETLDVVGPLGKGFELPKSPGRPLVLIGGGIAVAPLYFLARRIAETIGCECAAFLIGARTESMLLYVEEFARLGSDVRTATDDGSAGYRGFVTGLLEQYIHAMDRANPPLVYACGPMQMLKAVARITKEHGLKCQVSTEAKMACGVGACMSCVIKVRDGDSWKYVRCCKEGPVFDADDIIWE